MQLVNTNAASQRLDRLRERKEVYSRQYQFDRCVRHLVAAEVGDLPQHLIPELYGLWGDPLDQAGESYVRNYLAHAQTVSGNVLQCGAKLSTLLLGIVLAKRQPARHLWCLESDRHWANVVRSWLTQYNIGNTHIIVSPPVIKEQAAWYSIDAAMLPDDFGLVMCDGGSATVTGVVGLIQQMNDKLADGCIVLARNVTQAKDLRCVQSWAKQRNLQCVLVDRKTGFVKVSRPTDNSGRLVRPQPVG